MTNLKKTLAVVLAFAMMLSMGSVFAYSDVEEGTTVSEAVGILSNLEILTGFEDGTFRPDETVTRAQMAAIICRMLGYEDQAKSSMGSTVFNDVEADHWASGYVNVTQAQGIINGYGDGNFGPEDKVTYEQAIKMVVSALGYDLAAARKGGYPTGYLAIASAEGITKKANGKVGDAAARATVAVLVYNALEVQLMDQNSWSSEGDDRYGKISETVLTKYLGVTKWEGIVTTTPVSGVAAQGKYDPDATPKMQLSNAIYWEFDNDGILQKKSDKFPLTVCDKVEVDSLLGKSVIAYVGEDKNTGKDTVYAVVENAAKNEAFTISAVQLADDYSKAADTDVVYYTELGSSKVQDISLQKANALSGVEAAKVYVNYKIDNTVNSTATIYNKVRQGGIVEFISNDADTEYEVVMITAYNSEAVVEEFEEVNGVYKFEYYNGGKYGKIDTEDDEKLYIVYKDGEVATVADIAANDTVSSVEIVKDFVVFYVSSATVEGAVESYDDESSIVTIAGEDYEISSSLAKNPSDYRGEEGIFFLNVDGQIADAETHPVAGGNYALVLACYDAQDGVNNGTFLQVVLADGTLAEYKVSDTAKIYSATNKQTPVATDVKAYYNGLLSATSGTAKVATANDVMTKAALVVKATISNDKITKITLLPAGSATDKGKDYDAESMSIGGISLDDSTVIFSLKQTGATKVDPEDIVIGTAADFLTDGEALATGATMVAYDLDNDVYGVAIGAGLKKTIDPASSVFVVTGKKTTSIDDIDAYIFTGLVNGEETEITVYDEDEAYPAGHHPAGVAVGDVLLLASAAEDGYVTEIFRLVSLKTADLSVPADGIFDYDIPNVTPVASAAGPKDDIYSGYGFVDSYAKTKFSLDKDVKNDADGTVVVANTEDILFKSAANYTLVDFVDNPKVPEISVESGSQWLFDEANTKSYAYVRYVDDKLVDVVVYRVK